MHSKLRYFTVIITYGLPTFGFFWLFAREEGPRFMAIFAQWQTLTAGFMAIGAAFFSGYLVHRQTMTSERHEQERILRRFEAEKAVMPMTLSALLRYARDSADYLKDVHALVPPGGRPILPKGTTLVKNTPQPPKAAIDQAARFIESSPDSDVRAYLARILMEIQMQSARIVGMEEALKQHGGLIQSLSDVENHMALTGAIAGRCGVLFAYARGDGKMVLEPLTQAQVDNGLMNVDIYQIEYPGVYDHVDRYCV